MRGRGREGNGPSGTVVEGERGVVVGGRKWRRENGKKERMGRKGE